MRWRLLLVAVLALSGCSDPAPAVNDEQLPIVYNQAQLELGQTYRYKFYIHCGTEWLIDFNGATWLTDDPIYDGTGRYPDALRQFFANPREQISPELWTHVTLVEEDEIRLTLPNGSLESVYHPTDREWPGCA